MKMSNLAIAGDVHGQINSMYDAVAGIEASMCVTLGSILQLGDFHAIRDELDLRRVNIRLIKF